MSSGARLVETEDADGTPAARGGGEEEEGGGAESSDDVWARWALARQRQIAIGKEDGAVTDEEDEVPFRGLPERRYALLERLETDSYYGVYAAQDSFTGKRVMVKRSRSRQSADLLDLQGEAAVLGRLRHPKVIRLLDIVWQRDLFAAVVLEHLDMNLREYLRRHGPLGGEHLKGSMQQITKAIDYCHRSKVCHRDLHPSNLLLEHGSGRIKLAGFNLVCTFSHAVEPHTQEVVTLWYRAPELLLGHHGQCMYGPAIDIWALGCTLAELATAKALFPGRTEIDTYFTICRLLGTPTEVQWPGVRDLPHFKHSFPAWKGLGLEYVQQQSEGRLDRSGIELLEAMLAYDPDARPTSRAVLAKPFFREAQLGPELRAISRLLHKARVEDALSLTEAVGISRRGSPEISLQATAFREGVAAYLGIDPDC